MVAISIDKYLAIIYPMRPRMTKLQAKIIILVIWSAALLTSMPAALMSKLKSHTIASSNNKIAQAMDDSNSNGTQSISINYPPIASQQISIDSLEKNLTNNKPIDDHQIGISNHTIFQSPTIQSDQYTCQEDWEIWQPGKTYYSMTLMVLQFVLPLIVLVLTYTRIVIIVWGKKIPGEEDNARDARLARSKRKVSYRV